MYTIIDKNSGQEIRTHDMFRVSSPFPDIELGENEQMIYIPDNSTLFNQLQSAYECTLTVDQEGIGMGIAVTKTMEQYWQENPLPPQLPTPAEEIAQLKNSLKDTQEAVDFLIMGGM